MEMESINVQAVKSTDLGDLLIVIESELENETLSMISGGYWKLKPRQRIMGITANQDLGER